MDDRTTVQFRIARASDLARVVGIDDESSTLFASAGIDLSGLDDDHPFVRAEHARLKRAAEAGLLELALDPAQAAIGFIALGSADGKPYIEQLTVVPAWGVRRHKTSAPRRRGGLPT